MEGNIEENRVIEERKKKIKDFFSKKNIWIYVILIGLVIFAFWIRTLNTDKLKDVTTGDWTLGPDLDPFLFLRWAKYIYAHGSIMDVDTLRYVPIGFQTKGEAILLSQLIVWFHKFLLTFGLTSNITESAVYFPAFMFMLTVIAFFLLAKRLSRDSLGEKNAGIAALIACFFLIVIPALLPRTIAGIPEKESAGFFFMFMAFYFFLCGWKTNSLKNRIITGVLAGLSTGIMALIWGGFIYIFVITGLALWIAYVLGQLDKRKVVLSWIWFILSFLVMHQFSTRFPYFSTLTSTIFLVPLSIIIISTLDLLIGNYLINYTEKTRFAKIPRQIQVLIVLFVLGMVLSLFVMGPSFFEDKLSDIKRPLVAPIVDRLGVTVAENRQPYFSEWANSFGPIIGGIPLFFWLFIIGAIYIFWKTLNIFEKKERAYITISYIIFLFAIIFSRYSPSGTFNGTNTISIGTYLLGVLVLLGTFGYYYYKLYQQDKNKAKEIDFYLIFLFSLFFFSIISARGSVRTIMVAVPAISIIVGYFIVDLTAKALHEKGEKKTMMFTIAGILILASLYTGYSFEKATESQSTNYAPYAYTFQWQKAMSWVRTNTQENAVFAHWWDYGYWVQTIGERATVLDGGNAIGYWDHLMGRHGLTAPNLEDPLEFFYTHNVTHFLIDSTDIGKYSAFSSIGSDENYDRASYISTFAKDYQQQIENKNSTQYLFRGNTGIDSDINYNLNGTQIFLPAGKAGIGGIIVEINKKGELVKQPTAIVVYSNKQYNLPMRYAYLNNFTDFGSGIDSGIFIFPRVVQNGDSQTIDSTGALLYLSNKTVKSQLARLYLYNEGAPYFKLVHSEDSLIVDSIKKANATNSDFVLYNDIQGPIKIWEVHYPKNIKANPEYLKTDYPNKSLTIAK